MLTLQTTQEERQDQVSVATQPLSVFNERLMI